MREPPLIAAPSIARGRLVWRVAALLTLSSALLGCRKRDVQRKADAGVGEVHVKVASSSAPIDMAAARGKVTEPVAAAAEDPRASFVDNRVARAATGTREIVALRVWKCGPSCTCPPPCIQASAEGEPSRWLDVRGADGDPVALSDWATAEVTGSFTGRTRSAPAEPGQPAVALPELRLVGEPVVVATGPSPEPGAPPRVVLEGAAAGKNVSVVHDERPFLVIAGAFPLAAPSSEAEAGRLFEKLTRLGISDAERVDSRAFSALSCCFDLVVAGRFADAKAAAARQRSLVARGVKDAYVKRGF